MRDIPLSRRHNQGREGGSHKSWKEADATLPTSAEAKAALLYVYSHANTGSFLSKLGIWVM